MTLLPIIQAQNSIYQELLFMVDYLDDIVPALGPEKARDAQKVNTFLITIHYVVTYLVPYIT